MLCCYYLKGLVSLTTLFSITLCNRLIKHKLEDFFQKLEILFSFTVKNLDVNFFLRIFKETKVFKLSFHVFKFHFIDYKCSCII